jgi:hypothetical protein
MKPRWDRRFRVSKCGVGARACPLDVYGAAGIPPGADFYVSLTFANRGKVAALIREEAHPSDLSRTKHLAKQKLDRNPGTPHNGLALHNVRIDLDSFDRRH